MPRPKKFYDDTGLCRVTLKKGSARQPGGERPHAQYVQANGKRVDSMGLPVVRGNVGAFAAITWDFEDEPEEDLGEGAAEMAAEESALAIADSLDFSEVARDAEQSTTLFSGMQALDAGGFALTQGPTSEQNQLIFAACRLLIDPALAAELTLTGVVAREIGRAISVKPKVGARDRDRSSFVRANAEVSLREEGDAILYVSSVRQELLERGGADIGLAGASEPAIRILDEVAEGRRVGADVAVLLGETALAPAHPDGRARYEALWGRVYDLLTGALR